MHLSNIIENKNRTIRIRKRFIKLYFTTESENAMYRVVKNILLGGTATISNREPNEFYTKLKRLKNGVY
jgi:hypothetical protein